MQQAQLMVRCWNRGDLNCVVNDFYAKDFIYVGDNIITSKKMLTQHYQNAFASSQSKNLGQLKFDFIWCRKLGADHIETIEKYNLFKNKNVNYGYDLLVWKKIAGVYKIVTDFPKQLGNKANRPQHVIKKH